MDIEKTLDLDSLIGYLKFLIAAFKKIRLVKFIYWTEKLLNIQESCVVDCGNKMQCFPLEQGAW